jgi:hypothetical protein
MRCYHNLHHARLGLPAASLLCSCACPVLSAPLLLAPMLLAGLAAVLTLLLFPAMLLLLLLAWLVPSVVPAGLAVLPVMPGLLLPAPASGGDGRKGRLLCEMKCSNRVSGCPSISFSSCCARRLSSSSCQYSLYSSGRKTRASSCSDGQEAGAGFGWAFRPNKNVAGQNHVVHSFYHADACDRSQGHAKHCAPSLPLGEPCPSLLEPHRKSWTDLRPRLSLAQTADADEQLMALTMPPETILLPANLITKGTNASTICYFTMPLRQTEPA